LIDEDDEEKNVELKILWMQPNDIEESMFKKVEDK
jgi:hypothetical protein